MAGDWSWKPSEEVKSAIRSGEKKLAPPKQIRRQIDHARLARLMKQLEDDNDAKTNAADNGNI